MSARPLPAGGFARARAGRARAGPIVLVVPLLAGLLGALHLRGERPRTRPVAPPAIADPDELVLVLRGQAVLADGSRIEVALRPLHANPEHERFDGLALARRFGLEPGEPWHVELEWRAATAGTPDADGPRLAPAGLAVADVEGLALAPLASLALEPQAALGGAARDPLAVLFAPPARPLAPAQSAEFALWGRAPGAGAHCVWPDGTRIELETAELARSGVNAYLARLEPETADDSGKSPAARASEPAASEGASGW